MKMEDNGSRVVIDMTYREAEIISTAIYFLLRDGDVYETGSLQLTKLFEKLDEYCNT